MIPKNQEKIHKPPQPQKILKSSSHVFFGDDSQVFLHNPDSSIDQFTKFIPDNPHSMVDAIIAWFEKKEGTKKIASAKERFFTNCGKVFYDDSIFHQRINYFLDQLIFTPDFFIYEHLYSPLEYFLNSKSFNSFYCLETKIRFSHLRKTLCSIFEVKRILKDQVLVKDLISKRKIIIQIDTSYQKSLSIGSQIQGFLYFFDSKFFISKGTFTHSIGVEKIIKKNIDEYKKEGIPQQKILDILAKKQINALRHKNISLNLIYSKCAKGTNS